MTRWIVTKNWTVRVVINERQIITNAAPLVRRFIGQPLSNLIRWAEKNKLLAVEIGQRHLGIELE